MSAIAAIVLGPLLLFVATTQGHGPGRIAAAGLFMLWVLMLARGRNGGRSAPKHRARRADDRLGRIAPMTLADYRSIVAEVPAPTAIQIQDFARFVSEVHSWYKRLPLYRPGTAFFFFIDPFAGHDRVVSGGELRFAVRENQGFHYSAIPTREYHERFGHLAYGWFAEAEADRIAARQALAPGDDIAAVANRHGRLRSLPPEIVRAGTARLTAAVHPVSAGCPWWDLRAPQNPDELDWPEESGGLDALRRIFVRCGELRGAARRPEVVEFTGELGVQLVDPVLHALLSPERERQQRTIVQAIHRVCVLAGVRSIPSPSASTEPVSGATNSPSE